MNPEEDSSGAMIAPAAQVHAYAPTKIQKESLFFLRTTLLRDAILGKDDCGCEHDMT
jgi:hypothetical protein